MRLAEITVDKDRELEALFKRLLMSLTEVAPQRLNRDDDNHYRSGLVGDNVLMNVARERRVRGGRSVSVYSGDPYFRVTLKLMIAADKSREFKQGLIDKVESLLRRLGKDLLMPVSSVKSTTEHGYNNYYWKLFINNPFGVIDDLNQ